MKKITMKDIAKEADVSTATVSYILNNVGNQSISPETKSKVLKAAEKLKYVRNLNARSLKRGKSDLIGIMLPRSPEEPYWSTLRYANGVFLLGERLNRHGYQIVVASFDHEEPKLDVILERELDGVFVWNTSPSAFYQISNRYGMGVPVMGIDSRLDDELFSKMIPDFKAAFAEAASMAGQEADYAIVDVYNDPGVIAYVKEASGVSESNFHVYSGEAELKSFLIGREQDVGFVANEFLCAAALRTVGPGQLVALCTSDCPELLPDNVKKVVFDSEVYGVIAEKMANMIGNGEASDPAGFIFKEPLLLSERKR
ncbi:LacI family DNA-binding transcriptional regulator [Cohnella suwonensis]|uniref:LacI family DNA-binding transcriptional regulator n=1 Tax=Cohnella suwonensis TaxID=696072 RepID=A0ABW0LTB7_9BACL